MGILVVTHSLFPKCRSDHVFISQLFDGSPRSPIYGRSSFYDINLYKLQSCILLRVDDE